MKGLRKAAPGVLGAMLWCAGSGCATNAVLELELGLPPRPAPQEAYAVIQVRAGDDRFDASWDGSNAVGSAALEDTPLEISVSIVLEEEPYETDVQVRLRFCASPQCDTAADVDAPEVWVLIEQPFYEGTRTGASFSIGKFPDQSSSTPEVIERCDVRGCRDGLLTT